MYNELEDFKIHEKQIIEMMNVVSTYVDFKGKNVLNVGAGQGMHSCFLLSQSCAHLYETDIIDYDKIYNCSFRKLLLEKHERNGYLIDLNRVSFIKMSAMDILFKNDFFDIIISINAFEHIPSPKVALNEIIRCLNPGGYAFITFDPIYYCDTGGHMFGFVKSPWAHLLYSEKEYTEMMKSNGASDSDVNDFLSGVNKVTLKEFRKIFSDAEASQEIKIIAKNEWAGVEDKSHRMHSNFNILKEKYSEEDLLSRGMWVLFRKQKNQEGKVPRKFSDLLRSIFE